MGVLGGSDVNDSLQNPSGPGIGPQKGQGERDGHSSEICSKYSKGHQGMRASASQWDIGGDRGATKNMEKRLPSGGISPLQSGKLHTPEQYAK